VTHTVLALLYYPECIHLVRGLRSRIDKRRSAYWPASVATWGRTPERGDMGSLHSLQNQQRPNGRETGQQSGLVALHHWATQRQTAHRAASIFKGWCERGTGGFQWRCGKASQLVG
jgi:hypothetical protein